MQECLQMLAHSLSQQGEKFEEGSCSTNADGCGHLTAGSKVEIRCERSVLSTLSWRQESSVDATDHCREMAQINLLQTAKEHDKLQSTLGGSINRTQQFIHTMEDVLNVTFVPENCAKW